MKFRAKTMQYLQKLALLIVAGLFTNLTCLSQSDVPVSVTTGFRKLPVAELGETTPWPKFKFQVKGSAIKVDPQLSKEDREGVAETSVVPILPYLMQESYTRTRQSGTLPTVTLESDRVRTVLYPSLGGRLISLYDKLHKRELLFNNPVFQPANLAIRNAWFSGGIEWNGPIFGHTLLTCSPVFVGQVDTPQGPIVRIYEFDRSLETTWQVDLFLPPGEAALWIHVKAINLSERDIRFYWWTNIAVPMVRSTRVIVPMDYVIGFSGTLKPMPFPQSKEFDESYPAHYPHAHEFFFRKPGNHTPWSACVDGDGFGISHVSTKTLQGRKFFTWGTG